MSPTKPSHTPPRSIRIPEALWRPAQAKATTRGETLTAVITRALKHYLDDPQEDNNQ